MFDGLEQRMRRLWISGFLLTICTIMPAAAYDPSVAAKAFMDDFAQNKNAMQGAALVLGGWQGDDSKVADLSIERIVDQPAWQALWARHAPGDTAPNVDFSAAMVVAIFTGEVRTRVTPSVTLGDVTETDKITLVAKSFFNDVMTEDRGNLYLFVVLRRSQKPVNVVSRSISIMGAKDQVIAEFGPLPR
jgi:hypothetical protein